MSSVKGRVIAFVMAFCMIFTGVFNRNVMEASAAVGSASVTKCTINLDGNEINGDTKVQNGKTLEIVFDWRLDNTDRANTEYELDIASLGLEGLIILPTNTNLSLEKGTEQVGTYWVTEDQKLHISLDPDTEFFGKQGDRTGGVKISGEVNINKDEVEDHEKTRISIGTTSYEVIFDYGEEEGQLNAEKTLAGGVRVDSDGNLWQKFNVQLTASKNKVSDIKISDFPGSQLSNMSAISVSGTVSGGDSFGGTYSDMAALNKALEDATMTAGETLNISYEMQVAKDVYDGDINAGDYRNDVTVEYTTNHKNNKKDTENRATVVVDKPTIDKVGSLSAEQETATWTITITLGDYYESGKSFEELVGSVIDTAGAGFVNADVAQDITSLFQPVEGQPGTYVAEYTTYVTDEILNGQNNATLQNGVKLTMPNGHDYTDYGTVNYVASNKWIEKEFVKKEDGCLVWDVTLTPFAGLKDVSLDDSTDSTNKHWFVGDILVDGEEIIKIDEGDWQFAGTYTADAVGKIRYAQEGGRAHNFKLNFEDSYIQQKAAAGESIVVTYRTKIMQDTATWFKNTATVTYTDPVLNATTTQSADAEFTDDASDIRMEKYAEVVSGRDAIKYRIQVDLSRYNKISDMVSTDFVVEDYLPVGMKIDASSITATVGKRGWTNQAVTYEVTETPYTAPGSNEIQNKVTFTIKIDEAVVNRWQEEIGYGNVPFMEIIYIAEVEDGYSLLKEGKHSYTNAVKAEYDGIEMSDSTTNELYPQPVVEKSGTYNRPDCDYTIEVNENGYDLSEGDSLILVDELGELNNFIYGSVIVEKMVNGAWTPLQQGTDYKYAYSVDDHEITFTVPDNTYLRISYKTKLELIEGTFDAEKIKNSVMLFGFESAATKDAVVTTTSVTAAQGWVNSTIASINVQKFANNAGQMLALNGATFKLVRVRYDAATNSMVPNPLSGGSADGVVSSNIQVNADGVALIPDLFVGDIYALYETKAPVGYRVNEEPYYFVIRNKMNDVDLSDIPSSIVIHELVEASTLLYENEPAWGNLEITKSLSGITLSEEDKEKISFTIDPAINLKSVYKLSEFDEVGGAYKLSFTNIPVGDYKVVETRADIDGYTFRKMEYMVSVDGTQQTSGSEMSGTTGTQIASTVEENKTTTVNVTNTYSENIDISVSKTWTDSDNQDGKRPTSITVNLLADGEPVDSKTVTANEDWKCTFTDLSKYKGDSEIVYTITEDAVEGYQPEITGNPASGFVITNTHTPETVEVSGSKTWVDADNEAGERPAEIIVNLLANNVKLDSKKVTEAGGWQWSFTNLPKYANGAEIIYTISEEKITNYTTEITGYNITNTYNPGKTDITVKKVWEDVNDQDGLRPESVNVQLKADGANYGATITLNAENSWSYIWHDLDLVDAEGRTIQYTLAEVAVPEGYTSVTTGSVEEGFVVTNTHTPAVTSVTVSKVWNDSDNQDGIRPTQITYNLLADGTKKESKTVTVAGNCEWTFENLPKKSAGKDIVYTVTEDAVEGYTAEVTGNVAEGFVVTNTHETEKTSVSVEKIWDDADNQDGKRPTEITINLLADGTLEATKTITAGTDWKCTFDNLDKNKAGKAIVYTVEELQVSSYTSEISGSATDGFKITNTHTPETVSIPVSKIWNDGNNQDGKRPENITINLLADGTQVGTKTISTVSDSQFSFDNLPKYKDGAEIEYTVEELAVTGYTSIITETVAGGFTITNTHTPEVVEVSVRKLWSDGNDQDGVRPDEVTFNLLADGSKKMSKTVTATEDWKCTFSDLPKYDAGNLISYEVTEEDVTGYDTIVSGDAADGYLFINSHTPATIEVSGSKTWEDGNNQDGKRPTEITINLLADNQPAGSVTVTEADGWAWSFTNLPKFADGAEITYTISEETVTGYTTDVEGYNVTNTYNPEKTDVSVVKIWEDDNNRDNLRPESIKVQLKADGVNHGEAVTLDASNNWAHTWKELDKNSAGNPIVYTIVESNVPDSYTSEITGTAESGYTITNTYVPEKTTVTVSKVWDDGDDRDRIRPASVTIHLFANGKKVDTKNVTEAGGWKYTFNDLPKNEAGVPIQYTVTEDAVAGYTTEVNGLVVTNSYEPETVEVKVSKVWEDDDDRDKIRPASVTINLLANGSKVDSETVTAAGNWEVTFTNLPKNEAGVAIAYTVEEESVAGYTSAVTGTMVAGYVVTNTHEFETVAVSVNKTWSDSNNQDGKRPEEITVNLLANGEKVASKKVTEADGWKCTFDKLPKNEAGIAIAYTVTEDAVKDYDTDITGTMAGGYTITNSYTPDTVNVSGSKTWADADDQDGKRPASITINLLADNQPKDSVTVTEADGWKWSFDNLPKYANGKEITYTIAEEKIADYTTVITGYDVTNTYNPGKTDVTVKKVWVDANDQDGIRPESIQVQLKADGVNYGSAITLNPTNNWTHTWNELDLMSEGEVILYEVEESGVPAGYSSVISGDAQSGYVITNTHTVDTVSVSVNKEWSDANNQDGKRPNDITINLLADGVKTASKTVTAADGWKCTFDNLPKNKAGVAIVYTVEEEKVTDYTTVITGNMTTGFTVVNSHTPENVEVSGSKTWEDADNQDGIRPTSITINLLADNVQAASKEVTAANGWQWSFTDLPKYADGEEIVYTISEAKIPGYTTVITGYDVTNTYNPGKTDVSVSKVWVDDNNKDGVRPNSIRVQLKANGTAYGEAVVLNTANNWKYTWNDLDLMSAGLPIDYQVEEVDALSDYTSVITGDATAGFVITNTQVKNIAKLVIVKTIEGDATKAEAEAALEFTVTDNSTIKANTYTLKDFVYDAGSGTYTLELEVEMSKASGAYTVEETKYEIDGYKETVTYAVGSYAPTEGASATVVLEKDMTTTVSLVDKYEKEVQPTATPTPSPTPTVTPTEKPTATPTVAPSASPVPTVVPTAVPTATPTVAPSASPVPTVAPTAVPTATPTVAPSASPVPTVAPTAVPTATPTVAPSASPVPTVVPTAVPTATPTVVPSASPVPTEAPTAVPTATPTVAPSASPVPTVAPTAVPTATPTVAPSASPVPTVAPTAVPTVTPTVAPSASPVPTEVPTAAPTAEPSASPVPTEAPTEEPTAEPSASPVPTEAPTEEPTAEPSASPVPTEVPTAAPTEEPTAEPSASPVPTAAPTSAPTAKPTQAPTQPPVVVTPAPTAVPPTATPVPEIDISVPKTDDEAPVTLWLTLMMSSIVGMITVCVCAIKRKKNEDE